MTAIDTDKEVSNALFIDFVMLLRDYGVPASPRDLLELNRGLGRGVVRDLDDLFVFTRLTFVRRVEHMDAFERAFAFYFFGIDIPDVAEGDYALFKTKAFRDWLENAIEDGELPEHVRWNMDPDELMDLFWKRVREQLEEHHGGGKWIGAGGNSPFGHSGNASRGVRVGGQSRNHSAIKVIGDRRYVSYSDTNMLRDTNLRQALESMKHMKSVGAYSHLNLDETIRRASRNGGEIDLVFERDRVERMKVVLLIDNGGESMLPHVNLTRLLFAKLQGRFEELTTYYFHNTIYQRVWKDDRRTKPLDTETFLQTDPERRVIILGDASMAPEELEMPRSALYYGEESVYSSVYWLQRIADRFKHAVWLNPIPRTAWDSYDGTWTRDRIREIFHMEDLTLGGIKGMVEHLSET